MGHVYLYYGTGGGKTAASLGLALRSLGHGHRVVVVQFLKYWEETGEYKIRNKLEPLYEIRQFGRSGWIISGAERGEVSVSGFTADVRTATEEDRAAAKKALSYTKRVLASNHPPELLILDEICLAAYFGIVDATEVLSILDNLPNETDAVLTGRYAPKELMDRADFINEVREIKAPTLFILRKGIQY